MTQRRRGSVWQSLSDTHSTQFPVVRSHTSGAHWALEVQLQRPLLSHASGAHCDGSAVQETHWFPTHSGLVGSVQWAFVVQGTHAP